MNKEDFKDSFYIVGFSDNYWEIAADGFKREYLPSYYLLDIADTGVKIDIEGPPPKDKKYSVYVIIKVSNRVVDRDKVSHVQIREGVQNGLTQWY